MVVIHIVLDFISARYYKNYAFNILISAYGWFLNIVSMFIPAFGLGLSAWSRNATEAMLWLATSKSLSNVALRSFIIQNKILSLNES